MIPIGDIFNIELGYTAGSKMLYMVERSILLRFVKAYGKGDKSCMFEGENYPLGEGVSFKVYDILDLPKKTLSIEIKAISKSAIKEYRKTFIENHLDPMEIGANVIEEFLVGGHGKGMFGPKAQSLNMRESSDLHSQVSIKSGANNPIFISHSSKDKAIVDEFLDEFLERGLGVESDKDVYYTSSPVTGISAGSNWKEDIRQGLMDADLVFCFITENYTQSQYCIAELGAAWAFGKTIIPISVPPEQLISGGELYSHLQVINGKDRVALNRLRDDLVGKHQIGSQPASNAKWEKALSKYMEVVSKVESQKK